MRPVLKILRSAFASLQDIGRIGFEHFGVARAGFADSMHGKLANRLLGNSEGDCVVEIFAGAFECEFLCETEISTAGADAEIWLASKQLQVGSRVRVRAGDRLRIQAFRAGRILYLALAGGIAVDQLLGSRSTDLGSSFGGFAGRLLRKNDILLAPTLPSLRAESRAWIQAKLPDDLPLHFIAAEGCDAASIARFSAQTWRVSEHSQRTGARLAGEPVPLPAHDGVSRGVLPGVIQLPPSGCPIILGPDAQTIGGYALLGAIVDCDLWRVLQSVPGSTLTFSQITLEQARSLNRAAQQEFNRLCVAIEGQLD